MNKSPFLHLPDGFPWSHCVGAGANCGLLDDVTGAIFRNRSGEMGHVMPKTDWNGKFNMEHLDFLHGKKKLNLDFYVAKKKLQLWKIWIFTLQKTNATWPYKNWEHDEKLLEVGFISELKMMRITWEFWDNSPFFRQTPLAAVRRPFKILL